MDVLAPVLTALTAVVSIAVGVSGLLGRASLRASARFWHEATTDLRPGSGQSRAAEVAYMVAMARLIASARYPISGAAVSMVVFANASVLVVLPFLRPGSMFPAPLNLEKAVAVVGMVMCFFSVVGIEVWLARRRRARYEFLEVAASPVPARLWRRIGRPISDTALAIGAVLLTSIGLRDLAADLRVSAPGTYDWWGWLDRPVSTGLLGAACTAVLAWLVFLRMERSGDQLRQVAELLHSRRIDVLAREAPSDEQNPCAPVDSTPAIPQESGGGNALPTDPATR